MLSWLKTFTLILTLLPIENDKQFRLVHELDIDADFFYTDPLKNIYAVKENQLSKIDFNTFLKTTYSRSSAYIITSIDVSDPLRTLIFYQDFNQVVFIDKQLAEMRNPVMLDNLGYYNVGAICNSANKGFWILDENRLELVYFDSDLTVQKRSAGLESVIGDRSEGSKIFMLEKNDYIYLGIQDTGILLFDIYGSYIKTFPLKGVSSFQIIDQNIVYHKSGKLYFYHMQNFDEESIELPVSNAKEVRVEGKYLYIQTRHKILIYKWDV
ncbi:MAG: hypothetical protein R6V23_16485 [Bacteroidales bacterium]